MKPLNLLYDRSFGYVRGVLTFLVGMAFVIWPEKAKSYICMILGILILILGFAALVRSNFGKEGKVLNLLSVNGFLDIVFGLVLIIFSEFFVNLLTFLFGFLLLVFGISSTVEAVSARKISKINGSVYVFPILMAGLGIGMFFMPKEASNFIFRLFGIAILGYGLFEICVQIKLRRRNADIVEEVVYEEVKEN